MFLASTVIYSTEYEAMSFITPVKYVLFQKEANFCTVVSQEADACEKEILHH